MRRANVQHFFTIYLTGNYYFIQIYQTIKNVKVDFIKIWFYGRLCFFVVCINIDN